MEEKILNSQSVKTTIIDNITFTATSGDVTVSVDNETKIATISGGAVDISENFSQASAGYTFNISGTATINGIDYEGTGNVKFGASHWNVTLDKTFSVGNGSQSLGGLNLTATENISLKLHASGGTDTVTINGVKYSSKSDGAVSIESGTINISGDVSAANALNASEINTSGNGEINLLLAETDDLTLNSLKFEVTEPAIISINDGNVTSTSGAFKIKIPGGKALKLNGVTYTSNANNSTLSLNEGDTALTGKFKITLGSDALKLNKINVKGSAGAEFNFDSSGKNFVTDSAALEISASYGKTFKVNGVSITVDGESTTANVTQDLTTIAGNATVGDGATSLSDKNFSVSSGEIVFKPKSSDTNIKINDATFSGATNLTANFANTDAVKVEGTGVKIDGAGNFIIASTDGATINGTAFKSATAYAGITYNENDGYTLQTPFTVGDGTKNLSGLKISNNSIIKGSTFQLGTNDNFTIGGVTYSGDGEISVDSSDSNELTLTGKISVSNLNGKTYNVDENADVTFNFNADDTVTINGEIYQAANSSCTVTVKEGRSATVGSFVLAGDAIQTYDFKDSSSVTDSQGVTFTATSTAAKVTVDETTKKIKLSTGNVAITFTEENPVKDYSFSIAQNSTAQINGIDFTQTGATSDETNGDVVFTADDAVTLYSPFTIGNGTQPLNGLKVTIATNEKTTFNLCGDNDSVTIVTTGESADGDAITPEGGTIDGVTFTGNGTVSVDGTSPSYTVTLTGTEVTASGTGLSSITSFNLASGGDYTIGGKNFQVTNGGNSYNVSLSGGNVSSISGISSGATITSIGGLNLDATGSYTLNGNVKINNIDFTNTGTGSVNFTSATNFTANGVTFTIKNGDIVNGITYNGSETTASASTGSLTIGDVTYNGTGTVTVGANNAITVGAGVTGTATLTSTGITVNNITYKGTGTATITSSSVTVGDKTFSGTGSVDFTSATNFTANGVTFTIKNGDIVNGVTYNGTNGATASASTGSLTIGDVTYNSGTTIGDDGVTSGTITVGANQSVTVNGITYTNSTGADLSITATADGATVDGITYKGTGNATVESDGVTIGGVKYSGSGTVNTDGNVTVGVNMTAGSNSYQVTANAQVSLSNGAINVTSGEVNQTAGTFTLSGEEFDVDGTATWSSAGLISGGGTKSLADGDTYDVYTALGAASLKAVGNASGGYVTLNGDFTTTSSETFTHNSKTYTPSGTVTYKLTGNGSTKIENLTETLYSGTATSAVTGTKDYEGNTYTIDNGSQYTLTITEGNKTETLAASATFTDTSFKYKYNNTQHDYTGNATFKISYNGDADTDVTVTSRTGSGTRTIADTETFNHTYDGRTYKLSNGATVQLTFTNNTGTEAFYSGTATCGSVTSITANEKTYTSTGLTLTLTKAPNQTDSVAITSGTATRTATSFTYSTKNYTGSATYTLADNLQTETLTTASGTRAYDEGGVTFNNDTYTISGTHTINIASGLATSTTLAATGTFTATDSAFHYKDKDYEGNVIFTITYNSDSKTLGASDFNALATAIGTGTRTATAADSTITYSDGNNTYNTQAGSTIKINITGPTASTETFESGTATAVFTTDGNTFHYKDKDYKADCDNATLTLTRANSTNTVTLSGAGVRTDTSTKKFTYDNVEYTSGDVVYRIATYDATESVYTAEGTKDYTNGDTFTYDNNNYTATSHGAQVKMTVKNGTGAKTFERGSAKFDGGYIVKGGSKVTIGGVEYTASDSGIVTVTGESEITDVSGGTLSGTVSTSTTINGITYSGNGSITVGASAAVTTTGTFSATGTFNGQSINGQALTIGGTNANDVTVNLSGDAITATTTGDGTFTIGNETFTISGETDGVTFTLEGGKVQSVSGINVDAENNPVKITAPNGTTYKVRRTDDTLTRDGENWTTQAMGATSYTVTYDGSFKVTASDGTATMTLEADDYSANGTELSFGDLATAPVTVTNSTETPIKVGGVTGIGSGTIKLANNSADNFTVGENAQAYTITGGTFSVAGDKILLVGNGTFTVNNKQITIANANDKNTLIFDGSGNVTGINPASGTITVATGTFQIGGTTITVGGNTNSDMTFTADRGLTTISGISDNATITLTDPPSSLKVNDTDEVAGTLSETIKWNTTNNAWVAGNAAAQDAVSYQIKIASDNTITLYYKDGSTYKETTNVNDYKKVFSTDFDLTADGNKPSYSSAINVITSVEQITITPSSSPTYSINGQAFTISRETILKPLSASSIEITKPSNIVYDTMTINGGATATLAGATVTLLDEATVTNTKSDKTFKVTGTVSFDGITITGAEETSVTAVNKDSTSITIAGKTLNVTGDTAIGVKGDDSSVTELYKLSDGANVKSMGGAEKLSVDTTGNFIFEGDTYSIDDAAAYFIAENNKVKGVKNLGAGKSIVLKQDVSKFEVDADEITTSQREITLKVNGSHVTGVENLTGEISGLASNATVKVTGSDVKINGKALEVRGDNEFIAHVTDDGYDTITGINSGANISNAQEVTVIAAEAGTFTFNDKAYITDAGNLSFVTGDKSQLVSVVGLTAGNKFVATDDESELYVGSNAISLAGADKITLTMGSGNTISGVENLTGKIGGLSKDATVKVTGDDVKINDKDLKIDDTGGFIAHVTNDGYDTITGIDNGADITTARNATLVTSSQGTFNFKNKSYVTNGNNTVSLVTGDSSQLVSVGGLNDGNKFVINQNENEIYVGANEINLANADTVTLTMGNNNTVKGVEDLNSGKIGGLSTGATVKVTGTDVQINDKDLKIDDEDSNFIAYAVTNDGYNKVTGINDGANITKAESVSLVADGNGTYTFNNNYSYTISNNSNANVTLVTNDDSGAKVSDIQGLSQNAQIIFSKAEDGLKVGNNTVTFTEGGLQFTMGNGTVQGVESLTKEISGLSTNATVKVTTSNNVEINNKSLKITDVDNNFIARAVIGNGYDKVTGINNGANVQDAENATIVTAEQGSFTFQENGQYVTSGDGDVSFITGGNSSLVSIAELSNGSVKGDFSELVTVDGKAIKITEDTEVSVVANGSSSVTAIRGINNEAVVSAAADVSLVTAEQGIFTIGGRVYEVSGDDDVTLKTDANTNVAEINGLDENSKLILNQDERININGQAITVTGATSNSPVTLTMGSGNTISAVDNLKGNINGLSVGALVTVTTGENIEMNRRDIQINEGDNTNYVVQMKKSGYSKVTGLSNGAVVNVGEEFYLVTDEEGTYTFSNDTYIITGDNEVTLKTDDEGYGVVKEYRGLTGTLKTNEQYNTVNGAAIYSNDTNISIVANNDSGVSSIIGLGSNKELTVPTGTYVSLYGGAKTDTVPVTINNNTFTLLGDVDRVVIRDNVITGLNADARLTVGAAGDYTVNGTAISIADSVAPSLRVFIGESAGDNPAASARLYDASEIGFGDYTSAEDIAKEVLGDDYNPDSTVEGYTADGDNQIVTVDESVTGAEVVLKGKGDLAIIKGSDITVTTSGQNDSVVSSGRNVNIDANNNSTTVIVPTGGSMTIENFENAIVQLTNADIAAAVRDKAIKFKADNDRVTATLTNGATVTYNGDYVTFRNSKGVEQKFSCVTNNLLNASAVTDSLLVYADPEDDATITTGSGNDTAFVGAGSVVDLGTGNNRIEITDDETAAQIVLSGTTATNTDVKGFKVNDFEAGDVAKFDSLSDVAVTYKGNKLTLSRGTASLNLVDTYDGDFINVKVTDGSTEIKTSIAKAGKSMTVPSYYDDEEDFDKKFATAYIGDTVGNSGVDLSAYEATVSANLETNGGNMSNGVFGETVVTFRDIHSIKGGKGSHTLIGGAGQRDTLAAGTGKATIRGAGLASNDVLIGNSNQEERTEFIFEQYDGNDTIKNFQFYETETSVTADVVHIKQDSAQFISSMSIDADGNLLINMTNNENSLTIEDARGKKIKYALTKNGVSLTENPYIAKFDHDTISYDGITERYYIAGARTTVCVDENFLESKEGQNSAIIYLDGKKIDDDTTIAFNALTPVAKLVGLDASSVTSGRISLVGNAADNVIKAGNGGGELWGGSSGDDTLIGGGGEDIFWYGTAGGKDVIENYVKGDVIYCYNFNESNVKSIETSGNDVVLTFKTTNSHYLTIKDGANVDTITFRDKSGNNIDYPV